jgi:hypothetical protein
MRIAEYIEKTGNRPEGKIPDDVLNLSKTLYSIIRFKIIRPAKTSQLICCLQQHK